jgi:ubiquinone/menaquinone biosynthesis C-methylase UbiE
MPIRFFFKLIKNFDLATSLFRSFELSAIACALENLHIQEPILDLGCAEGQIAKEIFQGRCIYGLDCDLAFLLAAKRLQLYSSLIMADARKMPFKNHSYGFIFSNSVLEHINDIDSVLLEVKRIIIPKGQFIFTVPNENFRTKLFFYNLFNMIGLRNIAKQYSDVRNKKLSHFHLYSKEKWIDVVNRLGLKTVLLKDYIPAPILMVWDLIAAIQFLLRSLFSIFLKIPFIKHILLFFVYLLKLIGIVFVLPFFLVFHKDNHNECATLIVLTKNE